MATVPATMPCPAPARQASGQAPPRPTKKGKKLLCSSLRGPTSASIAAMLRMPSCLQRKKEESSTACLAKLDSVSLHGCCGGSKARRGLLVPCAASAGGHGAADQTLHRVSPCMRGSTPAPRRPAPRLTQSRFRAAALQTPPDAQTPGTGQPWALPAHPAASAMVQTWARGLGCRQCIHKPSAVQGPSRSHADAGRPCRRLAGCSVAHSP